MLSEQFRLPTANLWSDEFEYCTVPAVKTPQQESHLKKASERLTRLLRYWPLDGEMPQADDSAQFGPESVQAERGHGIATMRYAVCTASALWWHWCHLIGDVSESYAFPVVRHHGCESSFGSSCQSMRCVPSGRKVLPAGVRLFSINERVLLACRHAARRHP
eukprot:scaffold263988_cov20-Prasinocladus_malaysianus.AAC.2